MDPLPSIAQSNRLGKGAHRCLTMALGGFDAWITDPTGYCLTTKGGRQIARELLTKDIKQHLFGDDPVLKELAVACDRLEVSMDRMAQRGVESTIVEQELGEESGQA